jgi:hypothetical protein
MNSSEQHLTPSVEEFTGWYNLGYDRHDGLEVLNSQDNVPEFEHAEFFELYFEARDYFGALVATRPNVPFDPFCQPPFYIHGDADDRTLEVIADLACLDFDLLERIRKEFLGAHPLWRVILMAEHPSCSIVIYPSLIRFGNIPVGIDPERALAELIPKELALRLERERPAREHVARIRSLLPQAVHEIGQRSFSIAGILDRYEARPEYLTICLLIRGHDDRAFRFVSPANSGPEFLSRSSAFGLDERGALISYIEVPETAAFCLAQWLPPADYRGPLTLLDSHTGEQHTIDIRDEDIVRT